MGKLVSSVVSVAGFLLLAAPLWAVEAGLKPVEVTVYPDGAMVERAGEVRAGPGPVVVEIPGLPAEVDDNSVRMSVAGPDGTRFYGVRIGQKFSPEVVEPRAKDLLERIRLLEERKEDLVDRVAARSAEMDILKNLGKESAKSGANVGNFAEATKGVGTRLAQLMGENRRDERERMDLDRKISALRNELGKAGAQTRQTKSAQAELDMPSAGTLKIVLSYLVRGAGWSPAYDLKLDTGGKKPRMTIAFGANVRQGTGEDWNGVKLVVSTARPAEGGQVPDPTNWWLDFMPAPRPVYQKRAMKTAAAPAAMSRAENFQMDEALSVPVEMEQAETVRSEFAVSYEIGRPAVIPSDGDIHRVGIAEGTHDVTVTLVAVPRLAQAAFIEAEVAYGGEQQLMPGPAGLFRDGQFAGTIPLRMVSPGEKFKVSLGKDDNVKVERKRVTDKSAGGFLGIGKGFRKYQWVTVLKNFHPGNRVVEVREQLPRSRQKDIIVEPMDISPAPLAEAADQPGLKVWRLDIPARGEAKVNFAYQVKFPDGAQVYGLE